MNEISKLETKITNPAKEWGTDYSNERQVLRELKKEMGLPEDQPAGNLGELNIREAIEGAAAEQASRERHPGFIKAQGLDNE